MRISFIVDSLAVLSACTSGVQRNIESSQPAASFSTTRNVADQIACMDSEVARLPYRYSIDETEQGWELTISVWGGAAFGWVTKSKAIRTGQRIEYFMDAADLGMDAFGVKSAMLPILEKCGAEKT